MIFQSHWECLGGLECEPEPEHDEPAGEWTSVDPWDGPEEIDCCTRGCLWPAEARYSREDSHGTVTELYYCQECAVQEGYDPPALYPPAQPEQIADELEKVLTTLAEAKSPSVRAKAMGKGRHWLGVLRRGKVA